MGDITPLVGLGCDQVVGVEMVLYNGTVITANQRKPVVFSGDQLIPACPHLETCEP